MIVLIILAVILYYGIGGFICGVMGEEEMLAFYVVLWPVFIAYMLIIAAGELPLKLGKRINEWGWESHEKQEG